MIVKKLIILNGPPRSGKDTAAAHLWRKLPSSSIIRMSAPIKDALRAMFNFTPEEVAHLEATKGSTRDADLPCPLLLGKQWPASQINFSEQWAKPFFGERVFGEIFARKLVKANVDVVICPDGGFAEEWEPVLRIMRPHDVLHVKLSRLSTTFVGDSRNYYVLPEVRSVWVYNDGEVTSFERSIQAVVEAWLSL